MDEIYNKFNDYTLQGNMGFKIAIGNLVVSVACHDFLDAYADMENKGIVKKSIDFTTMPKSLPIFTFYSNNTEVAIFDKTTGEYLTDKFVTDADIYVDVAYGISPIELIDILIKVREYEKCKEPEYIELEDR